MITISRLALLLGAILPGALGAPVNTDITKLSDIIEGKYIVTLKKGVDTAAAESHLEWVADVHKRSLGKRDTVGIERKYDIKSWKGYAGEFDEATIAQIRESPDVRP